MGPFIKDVIRWLDARWKSKAAIISFDGWHDMGYEDELGRQKVLVHNTSMDHFSRYAFDWNPARERDREEDGDGAGEEANVGKPSPGVTVWGKVDIPVEERWRRSGWTRRLGMGM
jgi:hypothetical protein